MSEAESAINQSIDSAISSGVPIRATGSMALICSAETLPAWRPAPSSEYG
jgi:hypothetical protein